MQEIPLYLGKIISYTMYGSVAGKKKLFAKGFHGCRESFHYQCIKNKRMLFCSKFSGEETVDVRNNVIKFMNFVEDKLNVKSEFYFTDKKNIIYIKFHKFWMKQAMRKSLFTALLKAAQYFRAEVAEATGIQEEFDRAVNKIYYLSGTRKALDLFLSGHTKYTGGICGWYNAFSKPHQIAKLEKLLIKEIT